MTGVSQFVISPHKEHIIEFSYTPENAQSVSIYCDGILIDCGPLAGGQVNCSVPKMSVGLHFCQSKIDIVGSYILVLNYPLRIIIIAMIFAILVLISKGVLFIIINYTNETKNGYEKISPSYKQEKDFTDDLFDPMQEKKAHKRSNFENY